MRQIVDLFRIRHFLDARLNIPIFITEHAGDAAAENNMWLWGWRDLVGNRMRALFVVSQALQDLAVCIRLCMINGPPMPALALARHSRNVYEHIYLLSSSFEKRSLLAYDYYNGGHWWLIIVFAARKHRRSFDFWIVNVLSTIDPVMPTDAEPLEPWSCRSRPTNGHQSNTRLRCFIINPTFFKNSH